MNPILKPGFIAATALTAFVLQASGADNLAEALKNAKIKGQLKSFYFSKDTDSQYSSVWANGGNINFQTDPLNNLMFGLNFQTSHIASVDNKNHTLDDMDIQGSNLNEAYIQYTFGDTTFKGGRQDLNAPLSTNSKSKIITDSYEAYAIINASIPDTVMVLGQITKYMPVNDGNGNIGKYSAIKDVVSVEDAKAYTFIVNNRSVENLVLNLQLAMDIDFHDIGYFDATYQLDKDLKAYIAGQLYYTKWKRNAFHPLLNLQNGESNNLFGLKAGVTVSNIDFSLGYTQTGKTGLVWNGYGDGSYYQYTATTESNGALAFQEDTKAFKISASTNIKNLKLTLDYTDFDVGAYNSDLDEININLQYEFPNKFKGLITSVDYSILDYQNDIEDTNALRCKVIYQF